MPRIEPSSRLPIAQPATTVWPAAALIVGAIVIAYHNSLHGPFIFDDPSSITNNPTIRRLWPPWAPFSPPHASVTVQGRPILNFSLALNYALGGNAVPGYHAMNIAIHAIGALALFGLVRRTWERATGERSANLVALIAAVAWAVHPMQTEAITYVIQRAESLMGMFYLLTLYAFARSLDAPRGGRWLAGSIGCCALGMATKEVMVSAPVMVWLYDRTYVAGSFSAAWRQRKKFYLALAATWLVLVATVASTGGNRGGSAGFGLGVGWWDYVETQFIALAHYLRLSCWPQPLVFEYGTFWVDRWVECLPAALVVLAAVALVGRAFRRKSPASFPGVLAFAILSVTSLVPGTTQMIVEHRMYLPLAAVTVVAIGAGHAVLGVRMRMIGGALAGALAVLAMARNETYRSDVAIWQDTVAKRPQNALARQMYGAALDAAGDPARAELEYAEAVRLYPRSAFAQDRLGEDLVRQGEPAAAIAHFEAALAVEPNFPDAHNNLGSALAALGRQKEALAHFQAALRVNPDFAAAHYNVANLWSAMGRTGEAIAEYEATLRLRPQYFEAHENLANTLAAAGRPAEAVAEYERALRLRPEHSRAHYNLANTLAQSGRVADAVPQYRRALELEPDFTDAAYNLGVALLQLGRRDEAIATYEAALRRRPEAKDLREALAQLRAGR